MRSRLRFGNEEYSSCRISFAECWWRIFAIFSSPAQLSLSLLSARPAQTQRAFVYKLKKNDKRTLRPHFPLKRKKPPSCSSGFSSQENHNTFIFTLRCYSPPKIPPYLSQTLFRFFVLSMAFSNPSLRSTADLTGCFLLEYFTKTNSARPSFFRFSFRLFFTPLFESFSLLCHYQRPFQISVHTLSLIPQTAEDHSLILVQCSPLATASYFLRTFRPLFFLHTSPSAVSPRSSTKSYYSHTFSSTFRNQITPTSLHYLLPSALLFSLFHYFSPKPGLSSSLSSTSSTPFHSFHPEQSTTLLSSLCHLFKHIPRLVSVLGKLTELFICTPLAPVA